MSGRSSVADGVLEVMGLSQRVVEQLMYMLVGVFFMLSNTAEASPQSNKDPASSPFQQALGKDQMLVRELMRLDAEMALSRLQKGFSNGSQETPQAVPTDQIQGRSRSDPRLVAIYGVGQQLLAEVSWEGQSYVFLKGKAAPVGRNAAVTLRLKSLNSRCATLQEKDQRFELCLNTTDQGG